MRPWYLSAAILSACSGTEVALEVPVDGDTWVVALSTIGGTPTAELIRHAPGKPLSVKSDEGKPIFTWVLDAAQLIDPSGERVDLATARVRHTSAKSGGGGSCGRCLYSAARGPQLVNAGDSCPVPAFMKAALWVADGDKRSCRGGPRGELCAAGEQTDLLLLDAARRDTRLEWPGDCACEPTRSPSLAELEIRPVQPAAAAPTMTAMAQGPDGRVAGVSRFGTFVHDPATGRTETQSLVINQNVDDVAALRNGDFILVSEAFSLGHSRRYAFELLKKHGDALDPPLPLGTETPVAITKFEYLDGDPDYPLYLLGEAVGAGGITPAMAACDDETMTCQNVPIGDCRSQGSVDQITDAAILPSGIGIAYGGDMLYLKTANPPPLANPLPSDSWACQDRLPEIPWKSGTEPPVRSGRWQAMTEVGDHVFLCTETQPDPCGPRYAVVITATVTAPAGQAPAPSWQVVYRAPDWVDCRTFLRVPGRDIARAVFSGSRVVDFDVHGKKLRETTVQALYGDIPGYDRLQQDQPGWVLGWGSENQTWVATASSAFQKMYGGPDLSNASYSVIAPLPDGDFVAFGHPMGPTRVDVTPHPEFPTTSLALLSDPGGAFAPGDSIRAAILDATSGEEPRIVVVGSRAREPLLLWFEVEGTTISRHETIAMPTDLGEKAVYGVAQLGPDSYLLLVDDSILLTVKGASVEDVEIDYDDPLTPAEESMPTRRQNSCTHTVPRLHLWRGVAGAQGVGWVVGTDGMLLRVLGRKAERFGVPGGALPQVTTVDAICADDVRFGGFGRLVAQDSAEWLQFFRTGPAAPPMDGVASDPRAIRIDRAGVTQLEGLTFVPVTLGKPRVLFRDETAGRAPGDELPYAALLENGYLQRMNVNERPGYIRTPFFPTSAAQSPSGWILFGTGEARLALGVPR